MASVASESTMGNLSSMASIKLVDAPKGHLFCIVVLDAVSIICWFVTWFSVGPTMSHDLLYVSTACYGLACIFACVLPCMAADNKFWGMMRGICIVHVTTVMLYFVAAVLAGASSLDDATGEDGGAWHKDTNGKVDGMAIFAVVILVLSALGILLSLLMTAVLLARVRRYDAIMPMDIA